MNAAVIWEVSPGRSRPRRNQEKHLTILLRRRLALGASGGGVSLHQVLNKMKGESQNENIYLMSGKSVKLCHAVA